MKTMRKMILRASALAAVALVAALPAKSQFMNETFFNADWQVNVPLGNDFVSKTTGWGMNFEGGMYIPRSSFGVGAFFNYHTNNEYFGQQEIAVGDNGTMYTDQQHSMFQIPFGAVGRYRLTLGEGILDPYLGLKVGANFTRFKTIYSAFETYDNTWGFYLSPEIGTTVWPGVNHFVGLHLSLYYSFATNKIDMLTYKVDNMSNFGVRVGLSF